jgi:Methyltransferase FkbM domain
MLVERSSSPRRFWMPSNGWTVLLYPVCYYHFWIGFFIGFLISSFGCITTISFPSVPETTPASFLLPLAFHTRSNVASTDHRQSRIGTPIQQHDISQAMESSALDIDNDDGWNMIHVFVGTAMKNETKRIDQMIDASTISNDYFYSTQWFSQVQQDFLVYNLLKQKQNGYFIDLAANDAIRISNTFALEYYHHWDGIAIEPNPIYWSALAYRSCTVVAAVVGQQTGQEMKFKFPKHKPAPQGGLVGPEFDNVDLPSPSDRKRNEENDDNEMRYTVTLRDILERFHAPSVIDYFSLDIEGAETFVMESFPFDQYRFNVLTVERADQRLCTLLEDQGYVKMKQLKKWGETLWMHASIIHDSSIVDLSALSLDTESYKYRERVASS